MQTVGDANDLDALRAATRIAQEETGRPSLIKVQIFYMLLKVLRWHDVGQNNYWPR